MPNLKSSAPRVGAFDPDWSDNPASDANMRHGKVGEDVSRIFISHASDDNAAAVAIGEWLSGQGWNDIFLDIDAERGIRAGERWQEALRRASSRCELVLLLISPEWASSKWCLAEFLLAKNLNKRVLGVIIRQTQIDHLPIELTAEWQLVDLTSGPPGFKSFVTPIAGQPQEEITFSAAGLERLRDGLIEAGLDPGYFAWPPDSDPNRAPYRGLAPLDTDDAGIFFGREAPTIEVLDRLRGLRQAPPPRMFVILGASGAGKSSFMRAGVLPRLIRDSRHYQVLPVLRPNRDVFTGSEGVLAALASLADARNVPLSRAEIRRAVESGGTATAALIRSILDGDSDRGTNPTIVVPVDQAEELFQNEGKDEGQRFLELLRDMASEETLRLIFILTIRSDSYESLQTAPALEELNLQTFSLPPMPRGAYGEIISGPVDRLRRSSARQLEIDEGLKAALLQDIEVSGSQDALPLLSFTLERLYLEYGGSGRLSLQHYRELGGVRGSIEAAVAAALADADNVPEIPRASEARMALLRRGLVPWLAGINPETGTPLRRVARYSEIPVEARPLIDLLVNRRLLATDLSAETGEVTVEPAHEALLRQWGQLEGWLEEDFEDLTVAEGVQRAARDWEANLRNAEWLSHIGGRLESARRVVARDDFVRLFGSAERDYLDACNARHREQAALQRRTLGRAFVALSDRALQAGQEESAIRLAVAGALFADDPGLDVVPELRGPLLRALIAGRTLMVMRGPDHSAGPLAWDPELHSVLWAQNDRLFESSPIRAGTEPLEVHEGSRFLDFGGTRIQAIGFGGDAVRQDSIAHVLLVSADGSARISGSVGQDCGLGQLPDRFVRQIQPFRIERKKVNRFAPRDTETVVEVGFLIVHSKAVSLLTTEAETARHVEHPAGLSVLAGCLVNNSLLLSGETGEHRPYVWAPDTGDHVECPEGHEKTIVAADFAADGASFATCSLDGTARIWDSASGNCRATMRGHVGAVMGLALNQSGERLATAGQDGTVRIWDTATGDQLLLLRGHENEVHEVSYHPIAPLLASSSEDGTARVWDVRETRCIAVAELEARPFAVRFLSGCSIAVETDDGSLLTLGINGLRPLTRHGYAATGRQLLASGARGSLVLETNAYGETMLSETGGDKRRVSLGQPGRKFRTAAFDETAGKVLALFTGEPGMLIDFETQNTCPIDCAALVEADCVALGADRALLSIANGDLVCLSLPDGGVIDIERTDGRQANRILSSPDGRCFLILDGTATPRLWCPGHGDSPFAMSGHEGQVRDAAFSPDGTLVATAARDGTARLWVSKTGAESACLGVHAKSLSAVAFSADGGRLITTSNDRSARIWDLANQEPVLVMNGHDGFLNAAAFHPDGRLVATVGNDNRVMLWDVAETALVGLPWPALMLAATEAGIGLRTSAEAQDILMQDAPEDASSAIRRRLAKSGMPDFSAAEADVRSLRRAWLAAE